MAYDLKPANTPRFAGLSLALSTRLIENALIGPLILPKLLRDGGVGYFRAALVHEEPSVRPPVPRTASFHKHHTAPLDLESLAAGGSPPRGFAFERAADFARAYRERRTTPAAVAERLIEAVRASDRADPPLRAFIQQDTDDVMRQARASTERWRAGSPLSPLDGVPVAVKDELDQLPYPTTLGTRFLRHLPDTDATVVARLRAAGALLVDKANMHEIGIDVSGFNAHHGTARNPYGPAHYTGGSSSGSACAVAAGLCPIAVGADGGGSIRIPASLCGVVGLKPTYGRVSERGAFPLAWSVGHVGPIASTVRDAALAYAIMAGEDPGDFNTLHQPPPHLAGLGQPELKGLRLGVYRPWFEDAPAEIVAACQRALDGLLARGATVVEVELEELDLIRLAHGVTILTEMATAMERYDRDHRADYQLGVRISLAVGRALTSRDYVHAQRVRSRAARMMDRVFQACDVLVTPTTGLTAPAIHPDVLPRGENDLRTTSALMKYIFVQNFTGHPAITVPAGYDAAGLPIGLQATGRPWEENLLLQLGEIVESLVDRRAPVVHHRLLGDTADERRAAS